MESTPIPSFILFLTYCVGMLIPTGRSVRTGRAAAGNIVVGPRDFEVGNKVCIVRSGVLGHKLMSPSLFAPANQSLFLPVPVKTQPEAENLKCVPRRTCRLASRALLYRLGEPFGDFQLVSSEVERTLLSTLRA